MSRSICSCNWWSTNIGICSFTHGQLPICFNSPPLVFLRHFNQMKSTLLYLDKRSFSRKSLTPSAHRFNTKPESNLPHADAAPIKWRLSFDCPILIGGASGVKYPKRKSEFTCIAVRAIYHQRAATLTQCRRPFFLHFLSTKFVYATKPLMEIHVDCVTRCKHRIETVK